MEVKDTGRARNPRRGSIDRYVLVRPRGNPSSFDGPVLSVGPMWIYSVPGLLKFAASSNATDCSPEAALLLPCSPLLPTPFPRTGCLKRSFKIRQDDPLNSSTTPSVLYDAVEAAIPQDFRSCCKPAHLRQWPESLLPTSSTTLTSTRSTGDSRPPPKCATRSRIYFRSISNHRQGQSAPVLTVASGAAF